MADLGRASTSVVACVSLTELASCTECMSTLCKGPGVGVLSGQAGLKAVKLQIKTGFSRHAVSHSGPSLQLP